jgi:hypothetical protein
MKKNKKAGTICLNLKIGYKLLCSSVSKNKCAWKQKNLLQKIGCPHLNYLE